MMLKAIWSWKSFPKYIYPIVFVWPFTIQKKKKAFKLKNYVGSSLMELLSNSMLLN